MQRDRYWHVRIRFSRPRPRPDELLYSNYEHCYYELMFSMTTSKNSRHSLSNSGGRDVFMSGMVATLRVPPLEQTSRVSIQIRSGSCGSGGREISSHRGPFLSSLHSGRSPCIWRAPKRKPCLRIRPFAFATTDRAVDSDPAPRAVSGRAA